MLPLSEAAAQLLTTPPNPDALRFLGFDTSIGPWRSLFEQLLKNPDADFDTVTEESAAAEAA